MGTDSSVMFRNREALRAGEDSKQAMISTVSRAGRAIATEAGLRGRHVLHP